MSFIPLLDTCVSDDYGVFWPLISYVDPKTSKVVTHLFKNATPKNLLFIKEAYYELNHLYEVAQEILESGISSRYNTYYVPKKNGKSRRIDEPDEYLKIYMRNVIRFFTRQLSFVFPECVGAYVKGKSIKSVADKHVSAYAIAKFDIKDFFPNCTFTKIMRSLYSVYPFCLMHELQKEIDGKVLEFDNKLETIVLACLIYYDGEYRLPQGAPSSPFFSNIVLLPFDYTMDCEYGLDSANAYTRYADDLCFSYTIRANKTSFSNLAENVRSALRKLGFELNEEKTQFLKVSHGKVRVLGMSVGKDSHVTIPNKKKQLLKAKLFSFLNDIKNGIIWSKKDVNRLTGFMNYVKHIEPEFVANLIEKYEAKTGVCFTESVKDILHS